MQKPLISICCITYNHIAYIRQCLDGFLMQRTTFPYEIIINDDCSTDGTTDVIREYVTKYPEIIRPIYHDENQYSKGVRGMFATFCFPKAKGKYIAMCEGDDYWTDPLKLQRQVVFLEENPEYGLVYTNFQQTNVVTGEVSLELNRPFYEGRPLSEFLMKKFHIATLTVCFRKSLLSVIDTSYQEKSFLMGDYPLWIEIMRTSNIKYIPEITANYNVLAESASHSQTIAKRLYFLKNTWEISLFFAKKYKLKDEEKEAKLFLIFYDSIIGRIEHEYLFVILNLLKLMFYSPPLFFKSCKFFILHVK